MKSQKSESSLKSGLKLPKKGNRKKVNPYFTMVGQCEELESTNTFNTERNSEQNLRIKRKKGVTLEDWSLKTCLGNNTDSIQDLDKMQKKFQKQNEALMNLQFRIKGIVEHYKNREKAMNKENKMLRERIKMLGKALAKYETN